MTTAVGWVTPAEFADAVGTVARYLAEATYWVLKKGEPYREPTPQRLVGRKSAVSLKQGQVRT